MKNRTVYSDKTLSTIIILLTVLSVIMIYSTWSITHIVYGESSSFGIVGKQAMFLILSFLVYIFTMLTPHTFFKRTAYILWGIGILLLLLVFMFEPINESRSWIPLYFFNFQPSEYVKIAVTLAVAKYYHNLFNKYSRSEINIKNAFLTPLWLVLIPVALITMQPDPGTALIILMFCFVMLLMSGLKLRFFIKNTFKIGILVVVIALGIGLVNIFTRGALVDTVVSYQSRMINRFDYKDPCNDFEGDGFQICNSLIAINSGGVLGKGLGNSTQKYLYLPESHTDAIYAVTAEEFGFAAASIVLILYCIMIIKVIYYARKATDRFSMLVCVGIAFMLFAHVFVNIAGILNLIPFTGVPLPFFSYGGTFSILSFGSLGLIQSIAISINRERVD